MPRRSLDVSQTDIDTAISESEALARVHKLKPTWEDYKSEGVIDHIPDPGPDGKINATVQGHGNVVRMLKMQEEFRRAESWYCDNAQDSTSIKRVRSEVKAEKKARKFFTPPIRSVVGWGMPGWQYRCSRGHTFAFTRAKPDADARTCTRDGCGARALLERA